MALAQEWPLASGLPISGWHPEPGILSLTRSSVALVWFLQVAYGECTRCSAWQRAGVRERRWRDGRTIRRSVSGSGRTPSSYAGVVRLCCRIGGQRPLARRASETQLRRWRHGLRTGTSEVWRAPEGDAEQVKHRSPEAGAGHVARPR